MDGDYVASYGKIHASDNPLKNQNFMKNKMTYKNEENESITIEVNDIYKELRICGYDYGPNFRRLRKARIEDSDKIYGDIEWTGNMVTFLDALLQSQALVLPFRELFVPVMIQSVRCDPKKFFEAIEENKRIISAQNIAETNIIENEQVFEIDSYLRISANNLEGEFKILEQGSKFLPEIDKDLQYISIIPFFSDNTLKTIVTHGIEINGLSTASIARKALTQDLELETYQFIANEEDDAVEETSKNEIIEYIKV
jgi:hypothetical protein